MSRSLRRGAVAAVIIATAPILTACAAGENAASLHVEPDSAATSITKGPSSLKLDQIVVVTDATGQAPANIMTSISNNGTKADTLTSVTVDGSTQAVLSGPASIPVGGALLLSGPGQTAATVPTLNEAAGQNAEVTFTFANAGSVSVQALVNTGTGQFTSFAPKPTAAPSPSASAQKAHSSDGTSSSSSDSPSASPSSSAGDSSANGGTSSSSSDSPSTGANGAVSASASASTPA